MLVFKKKKEKLPTLFMEKKIQRVVRTEAAHMVEMKAAPQRTVTDGTLFAAHTVVIMHLICISENCSINC